MSAARKQDTPEDGNLPSAKTALDDAIHALTGPQSQVIDSRVVFTQSRYLQLQGATEGEQSNTGGGGGSKSRPPVWLDAFMLLDEIDTAIEIWQPAFDGVPPTVGRLHWIARRKWRPQDVRQIEQITAALQSWVRDIETLLNPPPRWTHSAPCPACGAAIHYHRDKTGELVRQPALQLGVEGCYCARCKTHWAPDKFVFLARVLGSLPENVLE